MCRPRGPIGRWKVNCRGVGESTYDPVRGQVSLDGHSITELDQDWYRRQVGVVSQEPILFATSIFENIRYGRPDASLDAVRDVAHAANALEFIEALPDAFDTEVGERGVRLSGGQRQRIAIARALLEDAPLLILDEATSALMRNQSTLSKRR